MSGFFFSNHLAVSRCPLRQAIPKALSIQSRAGRGSVHPGKTPARSVILPSLSKNFSTRSSRPTPAAIIRLQVAPRWISFAAAFCMPNITASQSGVPFAITPPSMSISAPLSRSTSIISASSLLAAQCMGVSPGSVFPSNFARALTSAPERIKISADSRHLGLCAG